MPYISKQNGYKAAHRNIAQYTYTNMHMKRILLGKETGNETLVL